MKSLSELQETLDGLQDQIRTCVAFITQLTGTGRKRSAHKANGVDATIREQVKERWRTERGNGAAADLESITVGQAAKLLKLSEAGVRLHIKKGALHAKKETRPSGYGRRERHLMVLNRNEVLAYSQLRYDQAHTPRTAAKTPAPKTRPARLSWSEQKKAKREQTAALLAAFDTKEARPIPADHGATRLGVLIQHGYLESRDNHTYRRTAKVFEP